jgi:hypothetical protein
MFIHLYERTSFGYRDAYRDLDSEVYVGEVKMLAGRMVREPRDFDDGGVRRHRVVAPSTLAGRDLTRAINTYFSHSGCRHEWDCCGCASISATAKRVSKREYVVDISTSYNY